MVKTAERQLGWRKIVESFRGASAASLLGATTGGNFTQASNTKLTSKRISELLRLEIFAFKPAAFPTVYESVSEHHCRGDEVQS